VQVLRGVVRRRLGRPLLVFTSIALSAGAAVRAACQSPPPTPLEVRRVRGEAISPEGGFSGVVGAVILRDGGLLIADAGRYSIHVFNGRGRLTRSVGGKGKGPAEYSDLLWLERCTDGSVVSFDGSANRIHVLDTGGAYQRTMLLPAWLHFDSFLSCTSPTQFAMLLDRPRTMPAKGLVTRFPAAVATVDWAKGRADTLAVLPGTDFFFAARTPVFTELPLGQRSLAAARAGLIVAGQSFEGSVRVFGRARDSLAVSGTRRPVSNSDWARAIAAHVAREPLPGNRTLLEKALAEAAAPKELPLIDALFVDEGGTPWARRAGTEELARWVSVTRGKTREFTLPRNVQLLTAAYGLLAGVERDADGLETIVLYGLSPDR
jgi:hypothetical protein